MTEQGTHKKRRKSEEGLSRNEIKEKRRKARHKTVMLQKAVIIILLLAGVGGGGFAIVWNLPAVKLNRELSAGQEYTQKESYDAAIESYENALKIDSASVKAYRYMASAYLDMEDEVNAKKVLYEGWENTKDEGLLQYYCTTILNEAVAEINENNCTFDTITKIVEALKQDSDNADALPLMHTAFEHLMQKDSTDIFNDAIGTEECEFTQYEQIMNSLFALYQSDNSEEIKKIIVKYSVIDAPELRISRQHIAGYQKILEQTAAIEENHAVSSLLLCLKKETEIQGIFGDLFVQFDAGNYEAAKEFIVTDTYTQIRDAFIEGTMEYWSGATYIPVSRETVILKQTEQGWTFEYPDFKAEESTAGIITVWGNKMTDDGIQRSCIAYEPAKETEDYYPHTEYVVSYMYSNVQKKSSFEAEMNYHLETRTWTEEGMTTVMIGDWGGSYQWEKTY